MYINLTTMENHRKPPRLNQRRHTCGVEFSMTGWCFDPQLPRYQPTVKLLEETRIATSLPAFKFHNIVIF